MATLPPDRLNKSEARIRRMFGAIAPWYDTLNHLLSLNIDRFWRRKTARLAAAVGRGPILDLCTGTGDLALACDAAAQRRTPIIGADFCAEMLTIAMRKTSAARAQGRIGFVQADAQRLPFPDGCFQLVCVAFGLRNIRDTDRGLEEMVRVLRSGGKLAILEFSQPSNSLLGRLYRLYFRFLLPLIGQTFSRSKENAYKYLPASVLEFPDGAALAERMRAHGLALVQWHSFTFGIATLYVGVKP